MNQQFEATAPDQIWLSDITYIHTEEGWLYLAGIRICSARRSWVRDVRSDNERVGKPVSMSCSVAEAARKGVCIILIEAASIALSTIDRF